MSDYYDETEDIEPDEDDFEILDGDGPPDVDPEQLLKDEAEFLSRYGFEHKCHCGEDWESGNLGVVAVCYLNMCRDALDHLATVRSELVDKDAEIAALRIELADA